jgi:prefoldin subunit 2
MTSTTPDNSNPELIIQTYKQMTNECQQLANKVQELQLERDEHKLVLETISQLEPERRTFRKVGDVLVERTVGEVLPVIKENHEGIGKLIVAVQKTLEEKDAAKLKYKNEHGIMTQEEREARMKAGQGNK